MAKKNRIVGFIRGEWFGASAYRRRFLEVSVVVGMFLVYIYFKYTVQVDLDTIIGLRKDLMNAKTEMVSVSSRYGSLIRESELVRMVDSLHLDLKVADQPPYDLDNINKQHDDGNEGK